jgi:hypothetical protein
LKRGVARVIVESDRRSVRGVAGKGLKNVLHIILRK